MVLKCDRCHLFFRTAEKLKNHEIGDLGFSCASLGRTMEEEGVDSGEVEEKKLEVENLMEEEGGNVEDDREKVKVDQQVEEEDLNKEKTAEANQKSAKDVEIDAPGETEENMRGQEMAKVGCQISSQTEKPSLPKTKDNDGKMTGKDESAGEIVPTSSLSAELAELNREAERINLQLSNKPTKILDNEVVKPTLDEGKANASSNLIVDETINEVPSQAEKDLVADCLEEKPEGTPSFDHKDSPQSRSLLETESPPSPSLLALANEDEAKQSFVIEDNGEDKVEYDNEGDDEEEHCEEGDGKEEETDSRQQTVIEESIVISDTEISDSEQAAVEDDLKPCQNDPLGDKSGAAAEEVKSKEIVERNEKESARERKKDEMEEKEEEDHEDKKKDEDKYERGEEVEDEEVENEDDSLPEYYTLVCMHVETFKISDSPDVSLTQVLFVCLFVCLLFSYNYMFSTQQQLKSRSDWDHDSSEQLRPHEGGDADSSEAFRSRR